MPYSTTLADKLRKHLAEKKNLLIEEKKMFGGLSFMINDKMCINISGDNLMCRFDASKTLEISSRKGYVQLIMRGKPLKGYCYVTPEGFRLKKDFNFWVDLCLEYNAVAKKSKSRR